MQDVHCNLCESHTAFTVATQNGHRMVQCSVCGLVYLNPRPSRQMLMAQYEKYHERDGKNEETWARLMEGNIEEAAALLNLYLPCKGKLLDIGCGYGHFLEKMQRQGWSTLGIDPSHKVIVSARAKGLTVIETTIDETAFSGDTFDAITAFYVLEHVGDPLAVLTKCLSMLRPGGMILLRVPHTTPIVKLLAFFGLKNNLYDLPFHLYDFSPRTLQVLLEKAGFSSVKFIPGRPTLPEKLWERSISIVSITLARFLFVASGQRLLLPGTSKTCIARRAWAGGFLDD